MSLTSLQWYVIAINIIAFLLYTMDIQISKHGGNGLQPKVLCRLAAVCGGAAGALAAELLWDRRIHKRNVRSRIAVLFWLILQAAFFWALWGPNHETAEAYGRSFYHKHKILCIYYAAINIVTFIMFTADKIKAMTGAWRIREALLLGFCLAGGGAGGILAMEICSHKVRSMRFVIGVPVLLCVHLVFLVLQELPLDFL